MTSRRRLLSAVVVVSIGVTAGALSYKWAERRSASPSAGGFINVGGAATAAASKRLAVHGTIAEPFYPGVTRAVDLVLTNPLDASMTVVSVVISVDAHTSKARCAGSNIKVTRQLRARVLVPAHKTRSLSKLGAPIGGWPLLTMPNLATSQDACKGAVFTLRYRGVARSR